MPTTKLSSVSESCPISRAILLSATPSTPLDKHCTHVPPLLLESLWERVSSLLDILDTHQLGALDLAASDLRRFMLELHTINLINSPQFTSPQPSPSPSSSSSVLPPRQHLVKEALQRRCPYFVEYVSSPAKVTFHKTLRGATAQAERSGRPHVILAISRPSGDWRVHSTSL